MKKNIVTLFIFMIIVFALSFGLFSCGANAQSDSASESVATAEGGESVIEGNDIKTEVAVQGVVVEARYTLAELIRDIYKDIFTRIVLCVVLILWATGNLHPAKGFKVFEK